MTVLEKLSRSTYCVEHNPNCTSPYLVRLVGGGRMMLDKLPPGVTEDAIGYGKTLEEAVTDAQKTLEAALARRVVQAGHSM